MGTRITKEFLQEHFRKHNSLTVYKTDGTPVTFEKRHKIAMCGGYCKLTFKTYDEFLGHRVCISEFMPNSESGSKPIAFGDFSYYWIVCRRPVSIRPLTEQFANVDCIGYLAYELLDGKLVRPEAIKVMQITD